MRKEHRLLAGIVLAIIFLGVLLVFSTRTGGPGAGQGPSARAPEPASLRRTDASGNMWVLELAGGQQAIVSTDPNGPKAGPPIIVRTDVRRQGAQEASIGLVLTGQAGEIYRPGITKNGMRRAAPALRIVNEAGQTVLQDNFSYG